MKINQEKNDVDLMKCKFNFKRITKTKIQFLFFKEWIKKLIIITDIKRKERKKIRKEMYKKEKRNKGEIILKKKINEEKNNK